MSDKQQRLVLSIIDFLNQSIADGTVKQDDKESLEVAIQCIGEAFGVDPSDEKQSERLSVKPATLQTIFDVFLKTRDKVNSSSETPAASTSSQKLPSAEEKSQAEKFKQSGNALMSSKKYDEAIDAYTKAIKLDATNPVFYSNRAAAHSSKGDHLSAVGDAEQAIVVDSKFVKAYHRLGFAHYSLEDYKAAANAFERGLALEPANASLKTGLENAKARIVSEESSTSAREEDTAAASNPVTAAAGLGGMADLLRGMGGAGGGMPDLASLMNNPALMQAAQQLAANGGLDNIMRNPAVANMMNRVQSGGGMPSMAELMSDPTLRNLASQFGGAGSGGPNAAP